MNTSLSDLTRYLALLAAPSGYKATARLLGGLDGDRVLLEARRRTTASKPEYTHEVSIEALEQLGAPAVATRFDRAARAALAEGTARENSSSGSTRG